MDMKITTWLTTKTRKNVYIFLQTVSRILLATNPILYWIAALTTTTPDREVVPVNADNDLGKFPEGSSAETIAVTVETGRNLYSPISTLVMTEFNGSELSNWTKIYFFGYLSLGTIVFAADFPGL